MNRYSVRRLKFDHWAMKVRSRPWAATTVVLHRLQRLTVHGPKILTDSIRNLECNSFNRATVGPNVFNR